MNEKAVKLLTGLGNLILSSKVSYELSGAEVRSINVLIDELQALVNALNDGRLVIGEPEQEAKEPEVDVLSDNG